VTGAQKRWFWVRPALAIAVSIYLVYRLTEIGWGDVLAALPSSPIFYLITPISFMVLPLIERIVYRRFLPDARSATVGLFARKKVLNEALLAYSGEAYLYERLTAGGTDKSRVLHAVKDNGIISALVGLMVTIILIGALILVGRSDAVTAVFEAAPVAAIGFGVIVLVFVVGFGLFFRRISQLNLPDFAAITGLHTAKITLVLGLQVLQWTVALPGEPWRTWLLFLAVQMLVKRLPFVPNADLVFLGVGLGVAGFSHHGADALSGVLVASAAAIQVMHLIVFLATRERAVQCA